MISCFQNYIGLMNVTDPVSGRYVNDLPGITTAEFDLIRKTEDDPYDDDSIQKDAWEAIETRAINKFEQKLNQWGAKYKRNYNYLDNRVTGEYTNTDGVPKGTQFQGFLFDSFQGYKDLTLHLQYVDLWSDTNIESKIRIYNAAIGNLIDEINFTATKDTINRVIINKKYSFIQYPKIFICYDDQDIGSKKSRNIRLGSLTNLSQKKISNSAHDRDWEKSLDIE